MTGTASSIEVTGQRRMGHHIHGFVASYEGLRAAAQTLHGACVCRLGHGLGFVPLTEDRGDEDDLASEWEHMDRLSEPMAEWAAEHSRHIVIAYIQTDYFAGTGGQDAIVWRDGHVDLAAMHTTNLHGEITPLLDGAINRALRRLGVKRGIDLDEFQAVGLYRHRDNGGWIAAARASQDSRAPREEA